MSILTIDGSQGEGGGQMLRSSLALSMLTRQPVKLVHIRAKRSKPGLQAQHLASVQAAKTVCNATVSGDQLGSQTVTFHPNEVNGGNYYFKIGTAGATALVLHTIYLPLLLRAKEASEVRIEGGTHALMAPSGEYLTATWVGYLRLLGAHLDVDIARPGFFPKGGGLLEARITPSKLTGWQSPEVAATPTVELLATLGGKLPEHIGTRMLARAREQLGLNTPGKVVLFPHTKSEGVAFSVIARQHSVPGVFFALGARGKPAESVADEAVAEYETHLKTGFAVDPHAADQLLLPLMFAGGTSRYRTSEVTQHLLTQRDVIGQFLDRGVEIAGNTVHVSER
jgi:RNA 3'-terminal phosphate cyclase (ATP)